jgi:hypothetical protein
MAMGSGSFKALDRDRSDTAAILYFGGTTSTPEQVTAYCRELMDVASADGGFIFSSGAGMQGSKPENVRAMMKAAKQPV